MAFPQTLDPGLPTTSGTTGLVKQGDNEIRDFKQFIVDVLGVPVSPTNMTSAAMSITSGGSVTFPNARVEIEMPFFITKNVGQENNFLNPHILYHADTERDITDEYVVGAGYEYHDTYWYGPYLTFKIYMSFRVPDHFDESKSIYFDFDFFQSNGEDESAEMEIAFNYRTASSGDNIVNGGTKTEKQTIFYASKIDYKLQRRQAEPGEPFIRVGDFSIGDTIQVYFELLSKDRTAYSKVKIFNFRFMQFLDLGV